MSLYGFQEVAVEALRENIRKGVKNQVLCAPTGSGKTEMALHLISECEAKGKRAAFVVDRISLLDQTSARMDQYGINHGVIQAQHWRFRPWNRIQVASVQTIARRNWPEDLALIVVDECHAISQAVVKRIMARDTVTVGLSATPFTKGLGQYYDAVVCVTTTQKLIESKYLAPFRIFAPSEPDMKGAKVVAGEWSDDEAARRSMPIIGDCVAEYLKYGNNGKAIVFGCTVAHCEEIQRQFLAAGVQAGLYTYQTGDDERTRLLEEYRKPNSYVRVLISVAALARGFDVPDVTVVICARPLRKSFAEWIQMIGRGLRRDPENPEKLCTILDHSGNALRFYEKMHEFFNDGLAELDDGKPKPKADGKAEGVGVNKCPHCHHVHAARPSCPNCGFEYPRKAIRHLAGHLQELGSGAEGLAYRERFYAELLWICAHRNWKEGFAAHAYKELFGKWPPRTKPPLVAASVETLKWVKHKMIRRARAPKRPALIDTYASRFAKL